MAKRTLLVVAASLLVACGSGGSGASAPCGPCQAPASPAMGWTPRRSAKLERLAQQRVELARKRLVLLRAGFEHGTTGLDALVAACRDVALAARDSGMRGETLRSILREYRDAMIAMRDLTRERESKGAVGEDAMSRVETLLAEAEFWLEEAHEGT
jgi:hypothetical protein